jgi:predicted LPLAT superfamily acyltransferase
VRVWVSDTVHGDVQVEERRVAPRMEAARAALETALTTQDVEELRRSTEAAWRNEQDVERLRARAVRVCEEALARAQRTLERVRVSEDKTELREVGLEAVMTAGKDTLCAMAVQVAAQEGVDVNTRAEAAAGEEPKQRWLRVATRNGSVETIRALLAAGADVNHADDEGDTALHAAAVNGHVETIRALAAAGADVNHADDDGITALHVAAAMGNVEALQTLLEAGAQVDHASNNGCTALHTAAYNGHVEAMQALVAAGAEVDHEDNEGFTALHLAAQESHVEII